MSLFVRESGPEAAPTILFLHGAALSGKMYQPQLERLAGDYHCLAPDLPEHGQSRTVAPLTMPDTVRRLAELIRERAAGRAHVVGVSWGGVVAQALMVAEPDLVDHVVLSGTSLRLNRWLAALNALNEPFLRLFSPGQMRVLLRRQFGLSARQAEIVSEDLGCFSADSFSRVNHSYREIETPTAGRWPVLVLVGEKETGLAKSMARRLAASIPGAVGRLVPGVGHIWNLQAPDLFSTTVRSWVADQPLPPVLRPL